MPLNPNKNIAERVIEGLLAKGEIAREDLNITWQELQHLYGLVEVTTDLENEENAVFQISIRPDYVICFSGRSGFHGEYEEHNDKVLLTQNNYDEEDTLCRFMSCIASARQATLKNFAEGLFEVVPVYFNGVATQNDELKEIIKDQDSFHQYIQKRGYSLKDYCYPVGAIIVDPIPLDNTMGQVLALSEYLEKHWPQECQRRGIDRPPNLLGKSSSYHVGRVMEAICADSPLHTEAYWREYLAAAELNPKMTKLSPETEKYALSQGDILRHSHITVIGCDRQMVSRKAVAHNIYGDMEAFGNYSTFHRNSPKPNKGIPQPSIAAHPLPNIMNFAKVAEQQKLTRERFFEKHCQRKLAESLLSPNAQNRELRRSLAANLLFTSFNYRKEEAEERKLLTL